jgi:hypothetical protein
MVQYVGTVDMTEEEVEGLLRRMGFWRNPVAYLKTRTWSPFDSDGVSEGSWVWRESLFAPMQLHVTIFDNEDDGSYDICAHWEANWISRPVAHLRETDLHYETGANMMWDRLLAERVIPYSRYD